MSLNLQYDTIGKDFVKQFYALFDDPSKRSNLGNLYSPTDSLMTYENHQLQGLSKIVEKVQSLSNRIIREITSVDCQYTIVLTESTTCLLSVVFFGINISNGSSGHGNSIWEQAFYQKPIESTNENKSKQKINN